MSPLLGSLVMIDRAPTLEIILRNSHIQEAANWH